MCAPMIWVIGTDAETRRLIGLNLLRRGFRCVEGDTHPEQAGLGDTPQLIILDEDSADDKGRARVIAFRQVPALRVVPLILIVTTAPTAIRVASLHPVRWMQKPLAIGPLLELVRVSLVPSEPNRASGRRLDRESGPR